MLFVKSRKVMFVVDLNIEIRFNYIIKSIANSRTGMLNWNLSLLAYILVCITIRHQMNIIAN